MTELTDRPKPIAVLHASARGIADRWRRQYKQADGTWMQTSFGSSEIVYNRLCSLGPQPSIDDAAKTIGNKGWSYLACDGCGSDEIRVVQIGESYSSPKQYCAACIHEAATAIGDIT